LNKNKVGVQNLFMLLSSNKYDGNSEPLLKITSIALATVIIFDEKQAKKKGFIASL
jgi:hypothetical protein